MDKPTVLVAGGAGYIGSHVNKMLHQAGYPTIVLDNLSRGERANVIAGEFVQGDIGDNAILDQIFSSYPIQTVMHFAAFVDVAESVANPALYYQNNLTNTLTLIHAMMRHEVQNLIFSSTAAVYGVPQEDALCESHGCSPINPYGRSKLMIESILHDYSEAYGFQTCIFRYFNAAGGDPEGKLKFNRPHITHLIPLLLMAVEGKRTDFTIHGDNYPTPDGTCIRDYIHIEDIGAAHILGMERLNDGGESALYNLGNGQRYSVKEVIQAVERVTGVKLNVHIGPRRPGDPARLVANASKAERELGWKPQYATLDEMIRHAWNAMRG